MIFHLQHLPAWGFASWSSLCHDKALPFQSGKWGVRKRVIQKKSGKGFLILQVTRSALGPYQESGLGTQFQSEIHILVALLKDSGTRFVLFGQKAVSPGVCSSVRKLSCKSLRALYMLAEYLSHFRTITKGKIHSSLRTEKTLRSILFITHQESARPSAQVESLSRLLLDAPHPI